jgi:peptidyl-dipeptidase A
MTENEIRKILKESTNSAQLEKAWRAYHKVGVLVQPKLKELVTLRNELARGLGYTNYHALQLAVQEFDGDELRRVFDALDAQTRDAFARVKAEIDAAIVRRLGLKSTADLRPWHFQDLFFQEAPKVEAAVSLDSLFDKADVVAAALSFYRKTGLGDAAQSVVEKSDLFEKPGKCPHAFCIDMDRQGDVRTLMNIIPNERWAGTTLHELGHGLYSKHVAPETPYLLHTEAHTFTTEAVAMFFGRLSKQAKWITAFVHDEPKADALAAAAMKSLGTEQLIFSRWTQVMFRFEQELYSNPEQDLSALWWDLKAKYQLLAPPSSPASTLGPDYCAKIHIVSAPVYYHNYTLGELLASQFGEALGSSGLGPDQIAAGNPSVGAFFIQKVFSPGATLNWRELVRFATGKDLSPDAFARQFL